VAALLVCLSVVTIFAPHQAMAQIPDQVAPQPPFVKSASERFAQAIAALDDGDLSTAQALFEQVIAIDPASPKAAEARHHLAQLYNQSGRGGAESGPPKSGQSDNAAPESGPTENPLANRSRLAARYQSEQDEFIGEVGDRVFFSVGSAELGARAVVIVTEQAKWLQRRPRLNANIEGHADEPLMSPEQNEALSAARAGTIRDRLVAEGIATDRLMVVPLGRTARVSPCAEPACQAQNRRAVTLLVPQRRPAKPPQRDGATGSAPARPLPTQ
jgi:outer membrane protein OmpA-like peptidoglycan-associated protein